MASSRIVIAPMGGLCNRMQTLASAIGLARRVGAELELVWYRSHNINVAFDDLFEVPDEIGRLVEIDLYRWRGRFLRKLKRKYFQTRFDHYLEFTSRMPGRDHLEGTVADARTFISAYRCFYESPAELSALRPVGRLRFLIDAEAGASGNTVGLHVRRADHDMAIHHSPLEAFVELIHAEIAADPAVRFFLATDSPAEEVDLRERFPSRIRTLPKRSLDRNRREAIEDAVVDLYCLSRCRKLIGSYDSSFSETAAKLGGIPLVTAYRE
jgi:hypothetical protein